MSRSETDAHDTLRGHEGTLGGGPQSSMPSEITPQCNAHFTAQRMHGALRQLIPLPSAVDEWKTMGQLSIGLIGPAHALSSSTLYPFPTFIRVVVNVAQTTLGLTVIAAFFPIVHTRDMAAEKLETFAKAHPIQARLPTLCFSITAACLLIAASIVHYPALIATLAIIAIVLTWEQRKRIRDGVENFGRKMREAVKPKVQQRGAVEVPNVTGSEQVAQGP
ncbi:hypothetical protein EXIGLDRAFT_769622 [Exidia glandulosa HHB12029]|uniref:Uncharacterized protein n=1 Tax=Exidia glandulosa HHB12029 TaxID=1314781 RepID=A0A165HCN5_EXIGL|nr:hypothetical protein EXIGLDRAFT_769622 [Exidia glandulosa HHB12029]